MFTGLVLGTGRVIRIDRTGVDARLSVEAQFDLEGVKKGDSIAVDGACLTVVDRKDRMFSADVSAETLSRTILGGYRPGSLVNLELALRFSDRLGGHLVTGHVDGLGELRARERVGESIRLEFQIPEELGFYLIEKGSIAINGISLTINECGRDYLRVNIVPHTAEKTTIGLWKVKDKVNIEVDIIGKYVARFLGKTNQSKKKKDIGLDFLAEHGFL